MAGEIAKYAGIFSAFLISATLGFWLVWLVHKPTRPDSSDRQVYMQSIAAGNEGVVVSADSVKSVVSTDARPQFAEDLTRDVALRMAPDRGIDEGQRNEAINCLREVDPSSAVVILCACADDPRESVKFRSWCYQHMGMLWSKVSLQERRSMDDSLRRGTLTTIDGPMWRESLLALANDKREASRHYVRQILMALTQNQQMHMGPLYKELITMVDEPTNAP